MRKFFNPTSKEKVVFFLVNVPYGVQKMSGTIKGLVETSTNIGILKTSENEVLGSSSIRSLWRQPETHFLIRLNI